MPASERRALAREAERLGCRLEDAALDRLEAYASKLAVWNPKVRLLGDRDSSALWGKHIPDCLALAGFLPDRGAVADIGTGAGLPGLVLACVRPDLEYWLIESRARRVSFLHEVKATLGLDGVRVLGCRAELLASDPVYAGRAAAVTSRAVSLEALLPAAVGLLEPAGRVLFMASGNSSDRMRNLAASKGLRAIDGHGYVLGGGERREILVLGRA